MNLQSQQYGPKVTPNYTNILLKENKFYVLLKIVS